jgi:prophage regulatory protein
MSKQAEGQLTAWAAPYGAAIVSGRAIIRRAELQRLVPFSMVHIWRLEKRGEFPRRVQLGANAVGWYADEVAAWCESRIRAGGRVPRRAEAASVMSGGASPLPSLRPPRYHWGPRP